MRFCAVPDDTPPTAQRQPIPSAGPYYVVSSTRDQLVLARNPNYRGDRPRIPEEIVFSFGVALLTAVKQVSIGHSDFRAASFASGGQSRRAPLLRRSSAATARPARRREPAISGTSSILGWTGSLRLQHRASPVRLGRLRRAVNYSIDRRRSLQHHFLFNGGLATDHYLSTGIPGSRPPTSIRSAVPIWPKPGSLAAGVREHATMYIPTGAPQFMQDARIVQTDLAGSGSRSISGQLPIAICLSAWPAEASRGISRFDELGSRLCGPVHDYNELYDPASRRQLRPLQRPRLTRVMREAATLTGARRTTAYARLDEDLTRNRPTGVGLGYRHFPRVLLRTRRLPGLPADLRLRPRNHLPSTMSIACGDASRHAHRTATHGRRPAVTPVRAGRGRSQSLRLVWALLGMKHEHRLIGSSVDPLGPVRGTYHSAADHPARGGRSANATR